MTRSLFRRLAPHLCLCLALCAPFASAQEAAYAQEAYAQEAPALQEVVYVYSDVDGPDEEAAQQAIDPGELPAFVAPLLDIARAELGYKEGARSYTKYGEWAGDAHAEWCAEFLCWCVDQLDKSQGTELLTKTYPNYSGQNTGRDWFIARGRFVYRKGNCPGWGYQWILGETELMKKNDYIPRPGDWMFFSYNEAGDTEHVAMVEYCTLSAEGQVIVHVIEGNNPSSVQRNRYYLGNSQILGFGTSSDVVGTTMRSGNRGDKVLKLQQDLYALGFLDEVHLTGTFGGNTKSAVADFQRTMEGKSVTGIADIQTQYAIEKAILDKEFNSPESWLITE